MTDAPPPEADRLPGAPHPRETPHLFGHEAAETAFLSAYASGQLHQAWLISGVEGIGKATLAWRIARFLLARPATTGSGLFDAEPAPPPESLDIDPELAVARRVAALSEPRLFLMRRGWDGKRHKTQITVDEARALKSFFQMSAVDGGWRVVIVDPAEEMNASAANAILKLLEEPPPQTVLLLVTHQPARLLPTIRSRCRTLKLRPLPPEALAEALRRTGAEDVEGPTAAGLAALAEGSVGLAFRLIEAEGLAFYAALVRLLAAAPGCDRQTAIGLAAAATPQRFLLQAQLVSVLLARLARAGLAGPPTPEAVEGEAAVMTRLSPDAAAARRWAGLQARLDDRARRAGAANLDPAATLLDMVLAIDGAAQAHHPA